jgi:hypothetical protein
MLKNQLNIVCIVVPEMGHFIPMLHIANELSQRGHKVSVISSEYGKEKCEKMIIEAGCKAIITQDGITKGQMNHSEKTNPTGYLGFGMWLPFIKEELIQLKPDIAVVDFYCASSFEACDELGIQVVTNMPGPLNFLSMGIGFNLPSKKNTSSCCGFLCVRQTLFDWFVRNIIFKRTYSAKEFLIYNKKLPSRIHLMNSFWGFDTAQPLPPNIILTGPLMKEDGDLLV